MLYYAKDRGRAYSGIWSEREEEVREPISAQREVCTWMRGPLVVQRYTISYDDREGILVGCIEACCADDDVGRDTFPTGSFDGGRRNACNRVVNEVALR